MFSFSQTHALRSSTPAGAPDRPPTTKRDSNEQSAVGERRLRAQLFFICTPTSSHLFDRRGNPWRRLSKMFCRVTHILLLSQSAKPLTIQRVHVTVSNAGSYNMRASASGKWHTDCYYEGDAADTVGLFRELPRTLA